MPYMIRKDLDVQVPLLSSNGLPEDMPARPPIISICISRLEFGQGSHLRRSATS